MSDLLKSLIKESGNEFAGIAADGIDGSDVTGFINTGSHAFNALLSGSLYGGMPDNKITAIFLTIIQRVSFYTLTRNKQSQVI